MRKVDVLEIRRRFTKENCSFSRLCGCYVDSEKNKVTTFNEAFLNLEDEAFYKYLEIVKTMFKGKIGDKFGDHLLERTFVDNECGPGTRAAELIQLRDNMKNEDALDAFYDLVIDSYDHMGNYLILLFHDTYDVMRKTSDGNELDESEEVFDYLICAICPVGLTKPGLEYREEENRIAPRIRDWVVNAPDTGFLYPAFTDRHEDKEHVLFYTKDAGQPHHELMEYGLSCEEKLTGTEKRNMFESVIEQTVGEDLKEDVLMDFNVALWETLAENDETIKENETIIDGALLDRILTAAGIEELYRKEILKQYICKFEGKYPEGRWIYNKKYLKKAGEEQEKENLEKLLLSAAKELERVTGRESDLAEKIYAVVTR